MEKRLIIAVALSLLILLGFQKLFPSQKQPIRTVPAIVQTGAAAVENSSRIPFSDENTLKQQGTAKNFFEEEQRTIKTDRLELVFTNKGGSLKALALRGFADKEENEELFGPFQQYGLFDITSSALVGLNTNEYSLKQEEGAIEYTYIDQEWLSITKRYEFFPGQDYLTLTVKVKNLAPRKISFSYQMVGPSGLGGQNQVAGRSFLEADAMVDDKVWKKKAIKAPLEKLGQIKWTALKNRYFAFILKPVGEIKSFTALPLPSNMQLVVNTKVMQIDAGQEVSDQYLFYAGPLEEKALKALGNDMDKLVSYGFFGPVSKVLLLILNFFYGIVRNLGVAIILLTVTVNLILFPLTYKSFSSMQQMKKIQPHLQQLKEMHKDNPQKLNKETMELYKKYNVNPLGGCLPLLLQMPIFIALYQGLIRSISLKGATFLWIKDLSAPDSLVKLSTAIPFLGQDINLLPILMIGAMFFQQKMSQGTMSGGMSSDQEKQQKTMMLMMPLLFGVFFYKMPSGLVLYWLTNTILMTLEHKYIAKRTG